MSNRCRFVLILFAAIAAIGSGAATEAPVPAAEKPLVVKLDMIDGMVGEQLDQVLASQAEWRAAEFDGVAADAEFRPQVSATADYSYEFVRPSDTQFATSAGERDRWSGGLEVRQFLYGFGKRSATSARTVARVNQAAASVSETRRDAIFTARSSYVNTLLAEALVALAKDRLALRQQEAQDARDLHHAGTVSMVDVRQAEINVLQAENERRQAETDAAQLLADLAAAIGQPQRPVVVEGTLASIVHEQSPSEQAQRYAEGGPEVLRLNEAIAELDAQHRQLVVAGRPDLFGIGSTALAGDDPSEIDDTWLVGLSLVWSLHDGSGRRAQRRALRRRIESLQHQRDAVVRERQRQYRRLQRLHDQLQERIATEQQAVKLATENYDDIREQYRAGLITLTRVSEVNLSVIEARFRLLSLLHDDMQSREQLRQLAVQ